LKRGEGRTIGTYRSNLIQPTAEEIADAKEVAKPKAKRREDLVASPKILQRPIMKKEAPVPAPIDNLKPLRKSMKSR